ncbi:MAG: hypothetical protein FWG63_11835 [Defluviitaleaceae bacterium]|nr:hypothetical protein [Defluviitaleaceae bacterium]
MVGAAPAKNAKNLGTANEFKDIKPPSKGKKIIKGIIIFTVLVIVLGSGTAILGFNVFNIRDAHLRPFIEPIPWVGDLLPALDEMGQVIPPPTVPELETQILALQATIDALATDNAQLNSIVTSQASDINSMAADLSIFETEHETFQQNQEEFYRMIIGEAPVEFTQFFEAVNPALAAEIYGEVVGTLAAQAALEEYVALFLGLSTRNAAEVLEAMISGQLPLVISILEALPVDSRATLVNAMDVENRTLVLTMLALDIEW